MAFPMDFCVELTVEQKAGRTPRNSNPNLSECEPLRIHEDSMGQSNKTRWWFQISFLFSPLFGEDSYFD